MSTPQQPIVGTPFDAASTAEDVAKGIDLTGTVAVVTGGHSGIGLETTRVLCQAGARVVVPVRNPDTAARALAGIDGVEIERLDLIDPASIDAFAARFLASGRPLHTLITSAGIMGTNLSRWATPEALRAMRLIDDDGRPVIDPYKGKKTVQQGASTSVWCAVSPQLDGRGGVYCLDNNIATLAEPQEQDARRHGTAEVPPAGVSPHAIDPEAAARLWTLSEDLTGTRFS